MGEPTPQSSEEAWLAYLAKEYLRFDQGSVEHDISSIIKQLLVQVEKDQSNLDAATRIAAQETPTIGIESLRMARFSSSKMRKLGLLTSTTACT